MNIIDLIERCADAGVFLYVEEGNLCFELSVDEFPSQLKDEILAHKQQVIDSLSQAKDAAKADDVSAIERVDDGSDRAPLAFSQQRLWFIERMAPEQGIYHMPTILEVNGRFDIGVLEQAVSHIIQRHEPLRTTFTEVDGQLHQVISEDFSFGVNCHDLTQSSGEQQFEQLKLQLSDALVVPFDLSRDLMVRGDWFLLEGDAQQQRGVLLINIHHIAADGWSMKIFNQELAATYQGMVQQSAVDLTHLPIRYRDYAAWQRQFLSEQVRQTQLNYWQQQLADLPHVHKLPLDHPRPAQLSFSGGIVTRQLPEPLFNLLGQFANQRKMTPFMLLHGVYALLLSRYGNSTDIVIGTPVANRQDAALAPLIGLFVNMLVLRSQINPTDTVEQYLAAIKQINLDAQSCQDLPFEFLVEQLKVPRSSQYSPIFQVCLIMDNDEAVVTQMGDANIQPLDMDTEVVSRFDLTLDVKLSNSRCELNWEYATSLFERDTIVQMAQHFEQLLQGLLFNPSTCLNQLSMLTTKQLEHMSQQARGPEVAYPQDGMIHRLFERQALQSPDHIALIFANETMTYAQLNAEANRIAHYLLEQGLSDNALVGICIERSFDMVIAMLAVLKAGGAYVPLDISYPLSRLDYIRQDAGLDFLLTQQAAESLFSDDIAQVLAIDGTWWQTEKSQFNDNNVAVDKLADNASNLAYVCYTSGSTGQPKGVMVEHGNVVNFFAGLDHQFGVSGPQTWLAVTSISFDISVTELLWTLTSGHSVVLQPERPVQLEDVDDIDFSLFYFAAEKADASSGKDKYKLLLEGATFADDNQLAAVWMPERHFAAFGAPFPNPAVAAAAVAARTGKVTIRAGSVVLPLHNTVRVAEEWSMVDNLSNGRVELSVASGWHPTDFVLAPDKFENRHQHMRDSLDTLHQLWQGESIVQTNGIGEDVAVKLYPRPIQPTLPIWVTAAYSPETFRYAGSIGANVLTHLLGQSLEQLGQNIVIYRDALKAHGFDAKSGKVALMLHTFVSDDADKVKATVKEPFKQYLLHSVNLLKPFAEQAGLNLDSDVDVILEMAFQRFFHTSGFFGTVQQCLSRSQELVAIGVDEVACLIDFGVEHQTVLANLPNLKRLQTLIKQQQVRQQILAKRADNDSSPYQLVLDHQVTHMQCTPQYVAAWLNSDLGLAAYGHLSTLMVGGEATAPELAAKLLKSGDARIFNMYGPTETTIWSAIAEIGDDKVTVGPAIANTALYVVDCYGQIAPDGVAGELCIAGDGVARGYLNRAELSDEHFVTNRFDSGRFGRIYHTGDLVRRLPNGHFEFIERIDNQVKILGHRIELGEVQKQLSALSVVKSGYVACSLDQADNKYLIGYVTVTDNLDGISEEILRDLRQLLPYFMVPQCIVVLDEFPLTVNGKIDHQRLPSPDDQQNGGSVYTPPRNEIEKRIEQIWQHTLECQELSVFANFFSLGGNSLNVVQIRDRLRSEFKLEDHELTLAALFSHQTIAAQADAIEQLQQSRELNLQMAELGDDLEDLEEEFF